MAEISRSELPEFLLESEGKKHSTGKGIFLFIGDRYLCREAADAVQNSLLRMDPDPGTVNSIDGETEDTDKTLGQLMNYSILPGIRIYRVTDSRLLQSTSVGEKLWDLVLQARIEERESSWQRSLLSFYSLGDLEEGERLSSLSREQWKLSFGFDKPEGDMSWADNYLDSVGNGRTAVQKTGKDEAYIKAFERGIPPRTYLLLSTEVFDKRKLFYKFVKKEGVVVNCTVDVGFSAAAQKGQRAVLQEMVEKTLAEMDKKIQANAMNQLIERVGFHPVAVVMEVEKLALYTGSRASIDINDLNEMVARTREDALFELTDAFGKRQGARTMVLLHRLQENGMHGLQILAAMRNYLRKLLIFRSMQHQPVPVYREGMSADQFQKQYLPALKEHGQWAEILKGHPYALFMSFARAGEFSCSVLKKCLYLLLQADYRLKSSSLNSDIILDDLFLTLLAAKRK